MMTFAKQLPPHTDSQQDLRTPERSGPHPAPVKRPLRASRSLLFALALALTTASIETAEAANWINCGGESGGCLIPYGERALVRYGHGNKGYFYWGTQGLTSVPCNNQLNGDPAWTLTKDCAYTTDTSLLSTGSWRPCANESGTCDVGSAPVWVRYGAGDRWYETIQSGVIQCTNAFFNFDPYPGPMKKCEVGSPVSAVATGWTRCSSESTTCTPSSGALKANGVLMRYGFGSNWTYRLTDVNDLFCNNTIFNRDPAWGQGKVCEYIAIPTHALTSGAWDLKVSCNGCYNSTFGVTWGTDYSTTQMQTQEWSSTVTNSVESGIDIKGVSASVSVSVSQTYAHSSSFSTSLSSNYGQSVSVTCGTGAGQENIRLYQFRTSTNSPCLASGSCSGSTFTTQALCVVNPPAGYAGPQCLPDYCADSLCTQCTYSGT